MTEQHEMIAAYKAERDEFETESIARYEEIKRLRAEKADLLVVLEKWSVDGHLQTFEDRERFRKEARAAISKAKEK